MRFFTERGLLCRGIVNMFVFLGEDKLKSVMGPHREEHFFLNVEEIRRYLVKGE
jgi:hypothetical protein